MDRTQAERLGRRLRDCREERDVSVRALAEQCGFDNGTLVRIEQGKFAAPSPDKLARLADALNLPLADVFADAGYVAPSQLPGLGPYLRARYALPDSAIAEITATATRWGIETGEGSAGAEPASAT